MKTLLLNLNLDFNIKYFINYNQYIILYKLIKYNINYKFLLLNFKFFIKKLFYNFKNKINSTKSNSKNSKTYYSSSHIVRKGLIWYGLRQLYLKSFIKFYNIILYTYIFNFRSNLCIINLELFKFFYYLNLLYIKKIKLFLNLLFNFNTYIVSNKYNLLFKITSPNINILY